MKKNIKKVVAFVALVLVVLGIILICWKHPVLGAIAITIAVCTLALLAFTWMIAPPEPKAQKNKKGKKQQRRKNKVEDEEFEEIEDDKSSIVSKLVISVLSSVCKKIDPHRLLKIRKSDAYMEYFKDNLQYLADEFEDDQIEATDFGVCLFYALMNEGKAVAKNPEEDEELAEDVNFRVALIAAIMLIANANLLDENVDPDNFKMVYPNVTLPKETYEQVRSTLEEVYDKGYSQKTAGYILDLILETKQIEVEEIK